MVIESVRPLGAAERLFYRYSERHPTHFLLVAEFDEVLTAARLRPALAAVQRRHPLLTVHVEDRPGTRLGFYRAPAVARIELTVHRSAELSWDAVAAEELSRTFDRSRAPLMRASLLQGPSSSALLLTFDHTLADGISSVLVLHDILAALNGETLSNLPVPQSQEQLTAHALGDAEPFDPAELPDDPRMRTPTTIRPFDGALTNVHTTEIAAVDTERLVQRCRAECTTVHSAMVVAMCRVRSFERGEDFVRVLNPINFRALIGAGQDCGLYIQSTWTGLAPWDGAPFWEQAREITAHLAVARSARGIRTASLAVQQAITVDAETGHAEDLFSRVCPFDMLVSNLGVQNLDGAGPLRPTAVWGPLVQGQTDGEYVTGITTYEGGLRMVTCGYSVPATFLKSVGDALAAAVDEP
ncbi:peptide synthetase [Mycobacterium sp. E2699]|nr:peptide synthetase [Mycobacterium sp. E2699]